MRILILGASGMLGHKLCQTYQDRFEVWGTVRSTEQAYATYGLLVPERLLGGVDVYQFDTIIRALATARPDAVINSIGIIKQRPTAQDPLISLTVNAVFPHRLANLAQAAGARLVHISTDCVFSGRKGMYVEDDVSDTEDLYGRSKFLGEVYAPGCLTLRTSIIGRELNSTNGLVEWFLSNRDGCVQGYTGAIYSGFTTLALAEIIADVLENHPQLSGLYHVSSDPIDKYHLLCLVRDAFHVCVAIEPYDGVHINRSLDSTRFRAATGFTPPSWEEMARSMARDPTPYEQWRK